MCRHFNRLASEATVHVDGRADGAAKPNSAHILLTNAATSALSAKHVFAMRELQVIPLRARFAHGSYDEILAGTRDRVCADECTTARNLAAVGFGEDVLHRGGFVIYLPYVDPATRFFRRDGGSIGNREKRDCAKKCSADRDLHLELRSEDSSRGFDKQGTDVEYVILRKKTADELLTTQAQCPLNSTCILCYKKVMKIEENNDVPKQSVSFQVSFP